jgi:hypothetical protein
LNLFSQREKGEKRAALFPADEDDETGAVDDVAARGCEGIDARLN